MFETVLKLIKLPELEKRTFVQWVDCFEICTFSDPDDLGQKCQNLD